MDHTSLEDIYKIARTSCNYKQYYKNLANYIKKRYSLSLFVFGQFFNQSQRIEVIGMNDMLNRLLNEYYAKWNKYEFQIMHPLRNNILIKSSDYVFDDVSNITDYYYYKFIKTANIQYYIMLPVRLFNCPAGLILLARGREVGEFTEEESSEIKSLWPWLIYSMENYYILKHTESNKCNVPIEMDYSDGRLIAKTSAAQGMLSRIKIALYENQYPDAWLDLWIQNNLFNRHFPFGNLFLEKDNHLQIQRMENSDATHRIFFIEPNNAYVHLVSGLPQLTGRELEVVQLLSRGLETKEISTMLDVSISTVQFHLHNLFEKYDVHTRLDLLKTLNFPLIFN